MCDKICEETYFCVIMFNKNLMKICGIRLFVFVNFHVIWNCQIIIVCNNIITRSALINVQLLLPSLAKSKPIYYTLVYRL